MRPLLVGALPLALVLLGAGCTTVHGVRPVGKGNLSVEGSLGGPLTEVYGAPIPIPLSSLGATYGVDDRTDVHAAWHPSPTLFFNLFGGDLGISRQFIAQDGARPRVMGDFTVTMLGGDNEPGDPAGGFRLYLQPTATASWDWGKHRRETFYAGLTALTEPLPTFHVLGCVKAGEWWAVGPRLHLVTELTWVSPYQSSEDLTPHYYAPGTLGAVEVQLGAGFTFGKHAVAPPTAPATPGAP